MVWLSAMDNSAIAGYVSILFWLIVFIPQLQENYKRQNGDGLSVTFLIIWLAGDIFNLAGIIMERLMFTMFLLALWYTIADISLIWQVVYYKKCVTKSVTTEEHEAVALIPPKQLKKRRRSEALLDTDTTMENIESDVSDCEQKEDTDLEDDQYIADTIKPKIHPLWVNLIGAGTLIFLTVLSCFAYKEMLINSPVENQNNSQFRLIPQILGWMSAVLYVGSRLPQLIKNWKQQSTEGLSSGMFICAVFGNAFFALSIFLKSTERNYILINLSWVIGSLGTVIFDIMIFLQFYVFKRRKMKHRAD